MTGPKLCIDCTTVRVHKKSINYKKFLQYQQQLPWSQELLKKKFDGVFIKILSVKCKKHEHQILKQN